jgi:hypothetical protein
VILLGGAGAVAIGLGAACTAGQTAYSGVTEPIQIGGAQFIAGDLPGTPPPDGGGSGGVGPDGGAPVFPPLSILGVSASTNYIISGISGVGISNLTATTDTVAVGVRLADEGTGYWVVPAAATAPNPGSAPPVVRGFPGFSANFNPADTPGNTSLQFVGLGSDGSAGAQFRFPICIESRVPDNGHACSVSHPPRPVPAVVFALRWDTNFDVDLNVQVPTGLVVNPKTQLTSVDIDGGTPGITTSPNAVGWYDGDVGVIDRDSMGSCVVDGWREEDLVFQDAPPPGLYDIYANPFASCGQASVRFTLTIYERGADGGFHVPDPPISGELLASQTTGGGISTTCGAATGLFVVEKQF